MLTEKQISSYIFGPVPSRRLGVSLGVDLVPFKTCSLNCIYCECGKTTNLTLERKEYAPVKEVLRQLENFLTLKRKIDYITFSGSGEPTLNSRIGEIILKIKKMTATPVAVLTNGTLLYQAEVRRELCAADVVLPNLDAVRKESFLKINQPAENLTLEQHLEGLRKFSAEFKGQIWLEVFIVPQINDSPEELQEMADFIFSLKVDKVQLNTLDRPPAFNFVKSASFEQLEKICELWKGLPVEIIKRAKNRADWVNFSQNLENSLLNALRRRPMTIDDLCQFSSKSKEEIYRYLDILQSEKKVRSEILNGLIFFRADN